MSGTLVRPAPPTADRRGLRQAVTAAVDYLWRSQRPDGSWETLCGVGPLSTAQMLVTLHYLGRLEAADARDAARWLIAQQRADGSWVAHPFADRGDLGVTATAWAALHGAGVPADAPAVRRARRYIRRHGGVDAVVQRIGRGDSAALNLAMAGLLDPRRLPRFPLTHCLVEPLRELMQRRFNGAILTLFLETAVLVRRLRGDWGPDGLNKPALDEQACRYLLSLLDEFRNDDGSWWNGVTPWSGMILATLHAMALPESADRIERGLPPIDRLRVRDADGLRWEAFGDGVWATGFNVRALLAAGIPADEPRLVRAADWLLACQVERPLSRMNVRRPDAPRTGGWSYQQLNEALPEADDTAAVVGALGQVAARTRDPGRAGRINRAANRGRDFLLGMQNADGGWATYVQGITDRLPGPVMTDLPTADLTDVGALAGLFFEPPADLGDPSTEDLAGRILHALAQQGLTLEDPAVQRGVEFLRRQQFPAGCWWGRWTGNYAPATAWVLIGLAAVGVDPGEPWVRRAVDWLLSRQNRDGGWGESHKSYRDPSLAGIAPSMAPVTGLVLMALCDLGLREHPAVQRGARYLIRQQRDDGSWDNTGYLPSLIPPDAFYTLPSMDHFWPLEGLARVLRGDAPAKDLPALPAPLRDDFLDRMRQFGDPPADQAAAMLFAHGGADAGPQLMALLRSDGPPPRHLPPALADYFAGTAALPDWADPAQLRTAQRLFARHSWEVALSLFCSALPQGYCSGPCARCMGRTGTLTEAARRRIFETARFLFDVLDEGGLEPGGRGIRACQKIRLMHAALRARLAHGQDVARDGDPVNQDDLHGTLLLFTVAPLDTLDKLGLPCSADEAQAWVHTWAVVGHLLGIDGRLLPTSRADADVRLMAFRRRHWEATPEGRALAGALVGLMREYYPASLDQIPIALIRFFAGRHGAELLGLPTVDWPRLAVQAGMWLTERWSAGDVQGQMQQFLGQAVQQAMKGFFLLQAGGQLNWAELLTEATRAMGLLAPGAAGGAAGPVRHLAYWLMKGLVLAERDDLPALTVR